MKNLFVTTLFTVCAAVTGLHAVSAQVTEEKIEVAHYRQFCEGVVPKKCLVIKRQGTRKFRAVQDEIENFDLIPGYKYVLSVEVEKVAAPPKDTSGWIYRLKEIVSRTEVDDAERDIDLFWSKWRLVRMDGKAVAGPSGVWMAFDAARGAIYGYGGCNSFSGSFGIDEDELSTGPLRSTKRACLIDWGVEEGLLKALAQGGKLESDGEHLAIRAEGRELLAFEPYE